MLVLNDRVIDTPIMSLQTGIEIAQTDRPIVDPRELKIVGFYCKGPRLDVSPAVLHVEDIREFSSVGFIVDGAEVIMAPADLVRLQQVIGINFVLEGKLVVDQDGKKLGKVNAYAIDVRSFFISQLHVQPSLLQSWGTARVIINRTQIIQIDDTKIVVSNAAIKQKAGASTRKTAVENPFKRPQPQTESSQKP